MAVYCHGLTESGDRYSATEEKWAEYWKAWDDGNKALVQSMEEGSDPDFFYDPGEHEEDYDAWRFASEPPLNKDRCAELERHATRIAASLAATISLLERGGKAAKKAAPSDTMFDQMLDDYRVALEGFRDFIKEGCDAPK